MIDFNLGKITDREAMLISTALYHLYSDLQKSAFEDEVFGPVLSDDIARVMALQDDVQELINA